MANSIINPIYLRPSFKMSAGSTTAVQGQQLTVTSTATSTFSAFDPVTTAVGVDFSGTTGAAVYATFDGQTPSSTKGHQLVAGEKYTWSRRAAELVKFVATSTANVTVWVTEYMV